MQRAWCTVFSSPMGIWGQPFHEGFRQDGSMAGLPSFQECCCEIPQDRLGDGADILIQHDAGRLKFRFRFFEALLI